MKAILEIEVPKSCTECRMLVSHKKRYGDGMEGYQYICAAVRDKLFDFGIRYMPKYNIEIPSFCPLKIMEDYKDE